MLKAGLKTAGLKEVLVRVLHKLMTTSPINHELGLDLTDFCFVYSPEYHPCDVLKAKEVMNIIISTSSGQLVKQQLSSAVAVRLYEPFCGIDFGKLMYCSPQKFCCRLFLASIASRMGCLLAV